jgi:hypothetical protein
MAKKFKVSISDTVLVPVKGIIKDAEGKEQPFEFSLTCKRLAAAEMREDMKDGERPASEIMAKVTTGWKGQGLVLDPDNGDKPAEFSADALDALLDISGVSMLCFNAFLREVGAKEKN